MDKGPWHIFRGRKPDEKLLGVISEDFEHDVSLVVKGDFASEEDKLLYCQWLRDKLNTPTVGGSRGD